ncbi:hypothetical protein CFP65_4215 [Kitasatospora sp. MMS16-BH015]|uniref:hypothetical protein n=1 Tax=Kitasatospora sp. MMS16-BH015 TaxID=2018025 RepID=UPI000CA32726|nr:hypothetical protein [Kitasatospora sp. MMS16-BH015]AUG78969.1 hypothetical protein CFP65_4215 [Kitasatospora sp. MMS16-BH015]
MPFENDFSRALDHTTDALDPDLGLFLTGAVQRGRRRKRRRNAAMAAGVGVAVGSLALATGLLPGPLLGVHPAGVAAAPAATPSRSVLAGSHLIGLIEDMYPSVAFNRRAGQDTDPRNEPEVAHASVIVDDGRGGLMAEVSATKVSGAGPTCLGTPAGDTCTLAESPRGDASVLAEQSTVGQLFNGQAALRWTVTVTMKATGAQLRFTQSNLPLGGGPAPTGATPRLSDQQVVAALTGPAWAPVLAYLG